MKICGSFAAMTVTSASDALQPEQLRNPRQVGTLHREGPVVVVKDSVLAAIVEFSEQDLTRERGGFLLGGVYGQAPQYVLVRHFHPALEAQGRSASLTFNHETWAALTRQLGTHFPDDSLIGWQHTHPGFGIFLSGYDLFIHKNFFSQPWQIALVVDPRQRQLGFFHWRDGEVRDCGFVCAVEL
jgi:proteasome lid subunit RPN8/RPN11